VCLLTHGLIVWEDLLSPIQPPFDVVCVTQAQIGREEGREGAEQDPTSIYIFVDSPTLAFPPSSFPPSFHQQRAAVLAETTNATGAMPLICKGPVLPPEPPASAAPQVCFAPLSLPPSLLFFHPS